MTLHPTAACLANDQLERFLAETSAGNPRSDAKPILEHLSVCQHCQERAQLLTGNNALLRDFIPRNASALSDVLLSRNKPQGLTVNTDGNTAINGADDSSAGSLPDDSFTGYQLLREIHRGGQGVVYQALQKSTRRKVAIKVMKEGPFAGPGDRARFDREVQVLGQLNHPNIVTIHDSGSAAGHYFFVMDYISGQPLDTYMAGATHSVKDTLTLFATICEAVNAAHLRGIIHRDLKPGNIRVNETGQPFILDFGLAKVATSFSGAESAGGSAACMTMTGQFVGSLPWASPEQAEGSPGKIDLRTDVYSLGVVLYQMLTGKFPYDVIGPIREVLDRIVKSEPVRPRALRKQINDEVQTIVLKCLQKERERRYQTAGEVARDVRHYLAGEPIEAKRDSGLYILRKTLNRHRGALVATAAVILALVAGVVVSTRMYFRERDARNSENVQRKIAERNEEASRAEAEKSAAALTFLRQMLETANPRTREGGGTTIREVMDKTVSRLDSGELSNQPEVEATVRTSIGSAYRAMGLFPESEAQLKASLRIRRQVFGAEHAIVGDSLFELAMTLEEWGRIAQSEPLYRESLQLFQRFLPANDDKISFNTNNLANVLRKLGRPDQSEVLFRRALEMTEIKFGEESREAGSYLNNLANVVRLQGRLDEAERLYRRSISLQSAGKADTAVESAYPLLGLAATLHERGSITEAETFAKQSMSIDEENLGREHAFCAYSLNVLGRILQDQERVEEAEPLLRRALDIRRQSLLKESPDLATSLDGLGVLLLRKGRPADAEPLLRECLNILSIGLPVGHERIAEAQAALGACLAALQRYSESESLLLGGQEGLAVAAKKYPSPWRIRALRQAREHLSKLYEAKGMHDRANEWRAKLEQTVATPSSRPTSP